MKISARSIGWICIATAVSVSTGPAMAQDIVIDSGSDETVITRLTAAGVQEQPVCSDTTDGTLGTCAPSVFGGPLSPFALNCFADIESTLTRNSCETDAVPDGFTFIVEHLSGNFVTREDEVVDRLSVTSGNQAIYLPVQFVSRKLNFGDPLGIGQINQYGSPATMYVPAGETLTVTGDANGAGEIRLIAIGRLVPN